MLHKRLSPAAWLGLAMLPVILLGAGALMLPAPALGLGKTGFYIALLVAMVVGLGAAAMHWKALDEAGRAAHRYAWYWGGSTALAIATLVAALVVRVPELTAGFEHWIASLIHHDTSPVALAFVLGVVFAALVQMVGYIFAWFSWWLSRRSAD